jgi:uncharacterized repeat protein (TIGR03803 family)
MKKQLLSSVILLVITFASGKAGVFCSMATMGGTKDSGNIIRFNAATDKDSVVWSFGSGTDGKHPNGNLVYDAGNGLLYGMTQNGGTDGTNSKDGVIFSFNPIGNAENVVWDFGNGMDGQLMDLPGEM